MPKDFEFNEKDLRSASNFINHGRRRLASLENEVRGVKKAMARRKEVVERSPLIPEAKTRDIVIAGVSWVAGAITAWAAHEKIPQLNVAAGAAGACRIAESLGMDRKGHGLIVGCGGGIGTQVLQRKAPVASLALPTIGFADLYATGINECDLAYGDWQALFQANMAMDAKSNKSKGKKPRSRKPRR